MCLRRGTSYIQGDTTCRLNISPFTAGKYVNRSRKLSDIYHKVNDVFILSSYVIFVGVPGCVFVNHFFSFATLVFHSYLTLHLTQTIWEKVTLLPTHYIKKVYILRGFLSKYQGNPMKWVAQRNFFPLNFLFQCNVDIIQRIYMS